jgi:hypothetical protein
MTEPEPVEASGASLSIWREAPAFEGRRTAALGAFDCVTAEAGARLLVETAERLADDGFEAVIGPMDGDTWSRHRLVVESDGRAPFLMEPRNPRRFPMAFARAGFEVIGRYVSAEGPLPPVPNSSPEARGLRLRALDPSRAETELARIYAVSLEAFAGNLLYRPQAFDRFLEAYRPTLGLVDPDLVILAEDETGAVRGFLFGAPDWADPSPDRAVICKTYASLDKGLGSLMGQRFYALAAEKGYRRCIHALMREDNLSARHSRNLGAKPFRRYALWGTVL